MDKKNTTRIDFNTGKFTANGTKYHIVQDLPVGRDLKYQLLVPKLAFGVDFAGIFATMTQIYKHATEWEMPGRALHEIATLARNYQEAVKRAGEDKQRVPVYYELCALFINAEGENPAEIDENTVNAKIQDWIKEGIPRDDFFTLAIASIQGLTKKWLELEGTIAEAGKALDPSQMDGSVTTKNSEKSSEDSENKKE
jgi:hypothetical protein